MNLNNWLCKHFDEEKKGYVTVGDVLDKICLYCVLAFIVLFAFVFFGMALAQIQGREFNNGNPPDSIYQVLLFLLESYKIPVIIIGVLIITSYYIYRISKIKIAKCPLKGDDYQAVSGWVSNDDNKQFQK